MENMMFCDLEVSQELKKAIKEMGFEEATPIQSQSIVPIIEGSDVVAQAPTGTGKTCAFGIPLIEKTDVGGSGIQGLILCPTRELVIQTTDELLKLSKYKPGIKIVPVYGGQQIDRQIFALKKKPQIIVATPGRLMDHMRRKTVKLDDLKHLILDEADEMLNMGFREDIDTILQSVPDQRQTVLFSATLSNEILDITRKYLTDQIMIKVTHKEITVPTIDQYYIELKHSMKTEVLTRMIDINNYRLVMVFCNTKRMVDELTENLCARGYSAQALHGDMKQNQRDKVMNQFKNGNVDILVATDVAARGIDVDNIEAVFNYDIPGDEEYYVHRIGRTGRANKKGVSYTLLSSREMYRLREIMRYTKSTIKPMKAPSVLEIQEQKILKIANEIQELNAKENHARYVKIIENIIENDDTDTLTTLDIAASLLMKTLKLEDAPAQSDSTQRSDKKRSDRQDNGSDFPKGDRVRLFLNIGTLDKIKKRHMIELFKMMTSVDLRTLDNIDIFDKYSFVTIPAHEAKSAVLALNGFDYRGRTLAVEIANEKRDKPRKPKSNREFSKGRNTKRYSSPYKKKY